MPFLWSSYLPPFLSSRPFGDGQLVGEVEQLDVESELAGGSAGALRLIAVGDLAWDPEARLFSGHHQLHALGPARDHLIQPEARRLAARHRAVEHLAVLGPARVVH